MVCLTAPEALTADAVRAPEHHTLLWRGIEVTVVFYPEYFGQGDWRHDHLEVMTAHPRLIREGALGAEALRLMNQHAVPVTCLFVVRDDEAGQANPKPVGIVHIHDCLRAGVA